MCFNGIALALLFIFDILEALIVLRHQVPTGSGVGSLFLHHVSSPVSVSKLFVKCISKASNLKVCRYDDDLWQFKQGHSGF